MVSPNIRRVGGGEGFSAQIEAYFLRGWHSVSPQQRLSAGCNKVHFDNVAGGSERFNLGPAPLDRRSPTVEASILLLLSPPHLMVSRRALIAAELITFVIKTSHFSL